MVDGFIGGSFQPSSDEGCVVDRLIDCCVYCIS
jgi:hypothetical protein